MDDRALQRLRWRSRRGLLELDLVFDRFWEGGGAAALGAGELEAFERLLSLPDNDLLDLVMGRARAEDPAIRVIIEKLQAA